jgi:hypothetical protein
MAPLKQILAELQHVEQNALKLAAKINISFTTKSEVKKQILGIQLAQEELNRIKQELEKRRLGLAWEITWQSLTNTTGRSFSEQLGEGLADSLLGIDSEERRKRLQREQSMLRSQIQTKIHHTIPNSIDQHLKKGDQLIALGNEYLKNPNKVIAKLQAERKQRLQSKLLLWGIVFAALIFLLIISLLKGWMDGSGIFAFLVGIPGLAFLALKDVMKDLS